MDGSYKLESFTDNKEAEVARLRYQVDLFYEREFELYKKIGLKDGMNIVECGSGPGFLISNIVRDLPRCTATAIEVDPFLVDQLTENSIVDGKKSFEVKLASIYETEQPDNYFDFAIARLVLEHLKEPEKAIAEVRRILKPGGCFVIVSNDFAYHLLTYPQIPELDKMYMSYIKSRFSEGGNPLIGRQLPLLLRKGKFEKTDIEIICVHSELEGDKAFLKAENVNISKSLVKEGFLKKEVLESLIEKWYNMLQQPDHIIFRQLFVISGIKGSDTIGKHENTKYNDSARSENQSPGLRSFKGMTSLQKESELVQFFVNRVRTIMDQQDLQLDPDTKLNDIDIDSIAAAELSGIVRSDFNTGISISDILQKFSLNDIVKMIVNNPESSAVNQKKMVSEPRGEFLEGEL